MVCDQFCQHQFWSFLVVVVVAAVAVKAQIGGLTLDPNDLGGSSTYGKDFYIAFLPNIGGSSLVELKLFVGTPASTHADFVVEIADKVIFRGNATFDTPAVVTIPNLLDFQLLSTRERNKGIHVHATEEEPIFVVCANYLDFYNYATFIAYPYQEFAIDTYEYRVISVNDDFYTSSLFLLVGSDDDTEITLVPNQNIELPQDMQDADSELVPILKGESHQFTLHKLQTLLVYNSDDLTGSKIVSNKPLTIISGHECALVPLGAFDCEHIAIQVPPTATWGTEFLVTGFAGRGGDKHIYRVVSSSEENTTIAITCGDSTRFITQTVYEFPTSTDNALCYVESTEPIFLTQLAVGGEIDFLGDPAIAAIAPVDQYVNEVEFISLPSYDFPQSYITVTVPVEHYDPTRILLNDKVFTCEWEAIYDRTQSIIGYGCSASIQNDFDTPTQHVLTHSNINGRLSVIVYGFNSFPQQGYAYLAGQALSSTDTPVITVVDGSLGFIDLEAFPSSQELPRTQDSSSEAIIIPDGLRFGNRFIATAFVNENGVISFNNPWTYSHPTPFPTNNFNIREKTWALAAFWSDVDIRKSGAVRYLSVSYKSTDEKELDILEFVSKFLDSQLRDVDSDEEEEEKEDDIDAFDGTWMLIAHWDHVHPSPHGADNQQGIPNALLNRTNNFQAVIITNASHTYYHLSYNCGDMQWSGVGRDYAVVGYVLPGMFRNHPSSGYASIANAVSACSVGIDKRRRKRQGRPPPPRAVPGIRGVLQLLGFGPIGPLGRIQEECLSNNTENGKLFRDFVPPPANVAQLAQELAATLPICPDSEQKIPDDAARFVKQAQINGTNCYVSARPTPLPEGRTHARYDIGLTQQCCYDSGSGSILTEPLAAYAGRMLLFHPLIDAYKENYVTFDEAFRDTCCHESLEEAPHCRKYFNQRPTNNGTGYQPPALAQAFTDPHYRTFDGKSFDFQGVGRFINANVKGETKDGNKEIVFSLQSDIGELPNWRGATWNLELAFGQKGVSAFHMKPNVNKSADQFSVFQTSPNGLNPRDINITDKLLDNQPWYDADAEAVLLKSGSKLTASFFNSGITIVANVRQSFRRDNTFFLDVVLKVPKNARFELSGLFGDLDGNPNNDLRKRDGTILTVGCHSDQLRQIYQTEWAVTDEENLFLPTAMKRRKRQNPDEEFVPILFENLNFTEEQIELCEGNEECLFDLAVTGEKEIAAVALEEQKAVNTTKEQLENTPPVISAGDRLRVNLGEEFTYSLTVVDRGDNVTLTVLGELANQARFEKIDDEEYNLKLNLKTLTNEALVLVANDSKGASATFIPVLEICACVNGGQCTSEGVLSTNATIIMKCLCDEAFSGLLCEEDRNGCSEIQCFEGVECLDVPAPGTGAECGACPSGYTGDGLKCYDVDECASGDDMLCEQECVNTVGSYTCDCREGYQIIEGTNQCEDVNECFEGTSECQHLCTNTIGSYDCSCNMGFSLALDGRNCTVNEPCHNNGGCSHGCAVVNGEAQCYCPSGYELSIPGGNQCVDINECLAAASCAHNCTNTVGSFECSCKDEGYELLEDGRSCQDVDECERAALRAEDLCEDDEKTLCVNSEGSFACVCVPGHDRINGTCQHILVEPPPLPRVAVPAKGLDSSLFYVSTALTLATFTPAKQQLFRIMTVQVITDHCSQTLCSIVLAANGDIEEVPIGGLQVEPKNIAIPTGLVGEDELGQLNITFYVQLSNGFLSKDVLSLAVQGNSEAYILSGFEEVDECSDDIKYAADCIPIATCVNTAGSFTCACPSGYSGDGRASGIGCPDSNECTASFDDCVDGATCMNNVGSFTCSCPPGYIGDGRASGTKCQDMNECIGGAADCVDGASCVNTFGSFTCSCPPGYSGDGRASGNGCLDVNECDTDNGGCSHGCTNIAGSYQCGCADGYELDESGKSCVDVNECLVGSHDCQQLCNNTQGSFVCDCDGGYDLRTDGKTCEGHVYFEFRGLQIPNNGYLTTSQVPLELVGERENGILCRTDKEDCCGLLNRCGEFYYPNGTQVPIEEDGAGFYRGRHDGLIRLNKRSGVTSPKGTFRCWLPDVNDKWHSIYINLV